MATDEAEALKDYVLSKRSPATPNVRPYYSKVGDFVSFCWEPKVPFFARRLDEFLTAYYSIETRELVGCKVKGVNFLISEMRKRMRMGVTRPTIAALSVAGRGLACDPSAREEYEGIWNNSEDVEISEEALQPA